MLQVDVVVAYLCIIRVAGRMSDYCDWSCVWRWLSTSYLQRQKTKTEISAVVDVEGAVGLLCLLVLSMNQQPIR